MAGMDGHRGAGGAFTSRRARERRRELRTLLLPRNNVTFDGRGDKERMGRSVAPAPQGDDMATTAPAPYYDPYDFEIDADPYPVWKRLRDEAPLYFNDKYEFYAVSRYEDVEKCFVDWQTYSSSKGSVIEIIKANIELPPGMFIFEDPPDHDLHRGLLSRVFTPKRLAAIEPQVRAFAARTLDPLVGKGGFDFIADLGVEIPMRTIGMLLGIPEEHQKEIRERIDAGLRLDEGVMPEPSVGERDAAASDYAAYIDWRAEHPSDDLMTELLTSEFTDRDGTVRTLTREEILGYIGLLSGAGNETTTRLIGWAGKLLAEHPDQRKDMAEHPELIPNAIEEILRYEPPSPVQARYVTKDVEHHGQSVPAGSVMVLLNASANRDERRFSGPDRLDIHRKVQRHLSFGYGLHFCLGAHLARLEARIALEEVLKRFPEWEVDYDMAVQARTSTVRGWETLPVHVP
jgi:cytochrome P450